MSIRVNYLLKAPIITFILSTICMISCVNNTRQEVVGPLGENAMISTAHPIATKIGIAVLKEGGNAFDAAVAIHFALAVVFPRAGNIGGGGFAVFKTFEGQFGALDFREKAPSLASKEMYLDNDKEVIKGLSTLGHLASGVPGSVDGILELHKRYGSVPINQLIQPAINVAIKGYPLTEDAAYQFNRFQEEFRLLNGEDFFLVKDIPWKKGDTVQFLDLAKTLTTISKKGKKGFYEGTIAQLIEKEMQSNNGLISAEDLSNYSSKWRDPVRGSYRGYEIISSPPPSSGGIALIQLLQGAEEYDIQSMGHNTATTIHYKTELERRVYADRATHLGDPDFYDVSMGKLLDKTYNKNRFSTIKKNEKTDSQEIKEGSVTHVESTETTHYSIVDNKGAVVSITTTLNGFFGCKVVVDGAGFFLNNEMDDFSMKPGVPNMFGLIGGEANAIVPNKRMLSSMTPTIVTKDNQVKMVVGTPGGATIITSNFQVIMNVIDHGMSMQEAVNAPRVHSQWLPDRILHEEDALSPAVTKELEALGHVLEVREKMGRMDCILIRPDGMLEGGADYTRGDNYAEGY